MAVRKAFGTRRSLLRTESGRGYRLLVDWAVRRHDAAAPPVGPQRMRVDGVSPITNFPATVTNLVGRAAAVARLRDLLSVYRVVTLTGPAGIGKTSLALKAARGIVGNLVDGGWMVELASLSDPALVPSTVAGVLGLKLGAGATSDEAVARAVSDDNVLLLLDNCEHVIDAVARLIDTVMRSCHRVTVLTTSREVLRVDGECVYRVPPLEVPPVDEDRPDQILSRGAVQLFVTRARALNPDFSPRAENPVQIAAICRQLDGIPLAIELAAVLSHVRKLRGDAEASARYLSAALAYLRPVPPIALATGGLPGTGKTTLARALAPDLGRAPGALILRSDEIRKRRHNVAPEQHLPQIAYTEAESNAVFATLAELFATAAQAGQAVIADATFIDPRHRHAVRDAASAAGLSLHGLWLDAPLPLLESRIMARRNDASDATVAVLHRAARARTIPPLSWTIVNAVDSAQALAEATKAVLQTQPRPI